MREQNKDESRLEYLLRVAIEFFDDREDEENLVSYDGSNWSGGEFHDDLLFVLENNLFTLEESASEVPDESLQERNRQLRQLLGMVLKATGGPRSFTGMAVMDADRNPAIQTTIDDLDGTLTVEARPSKKPKVKLFEGIYE